MDRIVLFSWVEQFQITKPQADSRDAEDLLTSGTGSMGMKSKLLQCQFPDRKSQLLQSHLRVELISAQTASDTWHTLHDFTVLGAIWRIWFIWLSLQNKWWQLHSQPVRTRFLLQLVLDAALVFLIITIKSELLQTNSSMEPHLWAVQRLCKNHQPLCALIDHSLTLIDHALYVTVIKRLS